MSDPSPTQPSVEPPSAVFRSRVEWIDTDAAGIYHNSTVIRLVESAEAQLMRAYGLPGYFAVAPRVRFEADFEAPLHFGQPISTSVVLSRIGRSSMTFDFEVWGESDDDHHPTQPRPRRRAARGRYVTAHVTTGDDGPSSSPWPAAWVETLSAGRPPAAP